MLNDLLSDSVTRIRNGYMTAKENVTLFHSKFIERFLAVLKKEGYIKGFEVQTRPSNKKNGNPIKTIFVELSYFQKKPSIYSIKMMSKPGRRYYIKKNEILDYYNRFAHSGVGTLILSTNRGLVPGYEAIQHQQGGELICVIF